MSKTKTGGTAELVSEARALEFCAQLNSKNRRAVAMCIDRRIVESGYPSGVRAGNPAWQRARLAEVSELIRRDTDLGEMFSNISHVEELLGDDNATVQQMARETLNRIQAGAAFLLEEARENGNPAALDDDD